LITIIILNIVHFKLIWLNKWRKQLPITIIIIRKYCSSSMIPETLRIPVSKKPLIYHPAYHLTKNVTKKPYKNSNSLPHLLGPLQMCNLVAPHVKIWVQQSTKPTSESNKFSTEEISLARTAKLNTAKQIIRQCWAYYCL